MARLGGRALGVVLSVVLLTDAALFAYAFMLDREVESLRSSNENAERMWDAISSSAATLLKSSGELRDGAGLVASSTESVDASRSDCDGVLVRFSARFNRLPSDAHVRLAYQARSDHLNRTSVHVASPADVGGGDVPAVSAGGLEYSAEARLSDLHEYVYSWYVVGEALEASPPESFRLHVESVGLSVQHARPWFPDAGPQERVVQVVASPDSPVCERVASATLAYLTEGGDEARATLEPPKNGAGPRMARLPGALSPCGALAIEWTLTDGRVLTWAEPRSC